MEAKPLVKEMLVAIQKMHKLGIVHRDLTPANIFLHFPNLPAFNSPAQANDQGAGDSPKSKKKILHLFSNSKFIGSSLYSCHRSQQVQCVLSHTDQPNGSH